MKTDESECVFQSYTISIHFMYSQAFDARILWTTRRVCVVTIMLYAVHMQFNLLSKL